MQILKKHKNLFLAIGFLVFLFIFHSSNAFDSDEGLILDGAWNMLHHRELYIDFFHFIPPASFFFVFAIWKIFGVSYLSAKLASVLVFFVGTIGVYKISKLFIKNSWAYLPAFVYSLLSFSWPIVNHNLYNIVCLIWTSYFILEALDTKKQNQILWAGFLSGLAILFSQSRAGIFFLGVSIALFFWPYIRKNYSYRFKLFFILPAIVLPAIVLSFWPLDLIIEYLIVLPSKNYIAINAVDFTLFIAFLLLYIVLLLIYKKASDIKIKILLFIQALFIVASLTRPDFYHVSIVSFPALILIVYIVSQKNTIFWQKFYIVYAILFFAIMMISSFLHFYSAPIFSINRSFDFVDYVKANCPGDYLYAGPFIPSMYFATDKLNPGPYYALFTGFNTPEQFEKQAEAIIDKRPSCAVLHYGIVAKFDYDIDNPVDRYILENYEKVETFGDGMIYKLK